MSDFTFSRTSSGDTLRQATAQVFDIEPQEVLAIEGDWGSVAFTRNRYQGTAHIESDETLTILIGGPYFRSSETTTSPSWRVEACVEFLASDDVDWASELIGPFCLIQIEKRSGALRLITDAMSFIPAYVGFGDDQSAQVFSTHPDIAALSTDAKGIKIDETSIWDLAHYKKVVFPHTMYQNVKELPPGSVTHLEGLSVVSKSYWRPEEGSEHFASMDEAADSFRKALSQTIDRIQSEEGEKFVTLSAGSDSRLILSMLVDTVIPNTVTMSPRENLESKIAQKVASRLNAPWKHSTLPARAYFDRFVEKTLQGGTNGHSSLHHFYGALDDSDLPHASAVVGGFKADTFAKFYMYKARNPLRGSNYQIPVYEDKQDSLSLVSDSPNTAPGRLVGNRSGLLDENEFVAASIERRKRHVERVSQFRPKTGEVWADFWPISQDYEMVFYSSNRRLYRAFEPFLCRDVVEIASNTPPEWQVNQKFFHRIGAKEFSKTRFVPHGSGFFPAFSWRVNFFAEPIVRLCRRFACWVRRKKQMLNQVWPSLNQTFHDSEFSDPSLLKNYAISIGITNVNDLVDVVADEKVNLYSKIAVSQSIASLARIDEIHGDLKGVEVAVEQNSAS